MPIRHTWCRWRTPPINFTNAPGGTAHWTFAGGTNDNDQSGETRHEGGLLKSGNARLRTVLVEAA